MMKRRREGKYIHKYETDPILKGWNLSTIKHTIDKQLTNLDGAFKRLKLNAGEICIR
jgi:hypothetical protein